MSRLIALEVNDAALVAVDESGVLFAEPGYAVADDSGMQFGERALPALRRNPLRASTRHWQDLSAAPLPRPLAGARTSAELVAGHLVALRDRLGPVAGLLVAAPAFWRPEQLGLFLDLCATASLPVRGVADTAVAAVPAPRPGRELLHLESSLHSLSLTRLRQGEQAGVGQRELVSQLGIEPLLRATAEAIARRFVACSRFDPLHDAATEQALHDELPGWLARLAREPEPEFRLGTRAGTFTASVPAAGLRSVMAGLWEPLVQKLRSGLAGRGPLAIDLHPRLADFPGVLEALLRLPDTAVSILAPGAAARGLLARATALTRLGASQSLLTSLPWQEHTGGAAVPLVAAAGTPGHRRPSHLLFGHRLYPLDGVPFRIGTELPAGERGIVLDPDRRGISRQHCTLRLEGTELRVFDHSRFGTWLNGHRVAGSAVLEAGDVLALGVPPVEFRLVAEEQGDGPA